MCIVHFYVFLQDVGGQNIYWNPFFKFVNQYGGAFFVLLSGVCVAFSRSSLKRGLIVFACGLFLTAATFFLYFTGMEDEHVLIQWGVLHLLGFCMMVYPVFKRLPSCVRLVLGIGIIVLGYGIVSDTRVGVSWLFPLGLRPAYFPAWDYFPVFPHLGWFLTGTWLRDVLYKEKKSLFPRVDASCLPIRLFAAAGRNSLYIYLLHLPLFYVVIGKYFA